VPDDEEAQAAVATLRKRLLAKQAGLQAEVKALVTPVHHRLTIVGK